MNFVTRVFAKKKNSDTVYKIGLLGNPNVGKSSLINRVIRSNKLKTGNWAGVTVAKKTVSVSHNKNIFEFTDLPGVFSFIHPNEVEEITINQILSKKYDFFVQILDGTNITNSLYLTMLLKELNVHFAMVINFSDRLKHQAIDIQQLHQILRKKVLITNIYEADVVEKFFKLIEEEIAEQKLAKPSAYHEPKCIPKINQIKQYEKYRSELGTRKAMLPLVAAMKHQVKRKWNKFYWYNEALNKKREAVSRILTNVQHGAINIIERKMLIQGILDNNHYVMQRFQLGAQARAKIEIVNKRKKYTLASYEHLKIERDNYINAMREKCFIQNVLKPTWLPTSRLLDRLFLNKVLAIPTLMLILLCLFVLIFNFTTPYKNFINSLFVYYLPSALHLLNNHHWYADLLTNGVFNAFGTMFSFLPVMYLLFVVLHVVEQSGLISRLSFMLDGVFTRFGMNGKSIIPLILGFGCNVGSIYATRAISSKREKKITAMISPFISCSARLVVFALFTSIFFNTFGGLVIFSLYILGIIVAFSLAIVFTMINKIRKPNDVNLDDKLYDLPKYKLPKLALIIRLTNYSVKNYTKRVLRIIVFFTLFVWSINYIKIHDNKSILFYFSYILQPLFRPLGFGQAWILCVALIPGIISKETTIATLALLFGIGAMASGKGSNIIPKANFHLLATDFFSTIKASFVSLSPTQWFSSQSYGINHNNLLSSKINQMLTQLYKTTGTNIKLVAYSYMCFVLLTIPCITTLGAIRHEYGWKTMLQSTILGIITPYVITLVIFQSVNAILIHK